MDPDHGEPETARLDGKYEPKQSQHSESSLIRTGRQLLYHPDDRASLTPLVCHVRAQIEAFVTSAEDRDSVTLRGGFRIAIDVGRVGVRCVHCARAARKFQQEKGKTQPPSAQRGGRPREEPHHRDGRAAVSYPQSIRLVYQSTRNWQRFHVMKCPNMPPEVKAEYLALKAARTGRSGNDAARYWEDSCRRMGMVDAEDGIRLRGMDEGAALDTLLGETDAGERGWTPVAPLGGEDLPASGVELPAMEAAVSPVIHIDHRGNEAPLDVEVQRNGTNSLSSGHLIPKGQSASSSAPASRTSSSMSAPLSSLCDGSHQNTALLPQLVHRDGTDRNQTSGAQRGNGIQVDTETNGAAVCAPLRDFHSNQNGDRSSAVTTLNGTCPEPEKSVAATEGLVRARTISPSASPGAQLPRTAVLERVELAHSLVRAIGEIRELPPGIGAGGETARPSASSEGGLAQGDELRHLGMELYNLFSGGRTLDLVEEGCGGDNEAGGLAPPQRRKKGRVTERLQEQIAMLADAGIPLALCSLLSTLMVSAAGCVDGGADVYTCIEEVEEDLRLMAAEPDRYLFRSMNAGGGSGPHRQIDFANLLYGRRAEMAKLLDAYEETVSPDASDERSRMVLLSGYSGTGKSAIVEKARGLVVERGACFISGKFDTMWQIRPLSAILSALNEYCDLLAEDADRIDLVRKSVTAALRGEGGVPADLVPNLRKIVDTAEGGSFAQISGPKALWRLMFLFRTLLRATCSRANPVVLFLDDLQWADEVSLELMHMLVADTQVRGLLFVGCYRDNEVSQDHPFMVHLKNMVCSGSVTAISIHVANLDGDSVSALVSDALHLMPRTTRSLAEVVRHKTGGNALFVVQFLASLCDAGLLWYSLLSQRWEWDIDGIREREIAYNVVELMTAKLLGLAPEVNEGLRVAAAFGAQCQKDVLHILDRDPCRIRSTVAALDVAVEEGLVSKVDKKSAYRFSHDQIQSAAYQLTKNSERAAFHLKIGRSLWQNASPEEMESYAFVIVDQLHRGAGLISDREEKVKLAQLSLMAGQKASTMSAFLPASVYLKTGVGLITNDDWDHHRDLCLELCTSCAEMEYVLGDFESVQNHLEHVLQRARTLSEKLRAYHTLVGSMGSQGKTIDAINTSVAVLGRLGVCLSANVDETILMQELMMTQKLLGTKRRDDDKVDNLLHLKTMEDFEKSQAMRFLKTMYLSVFAESRRALMSLIACRMVRLSLAYGICKESAIAFGSYGMVLCGLMSDFAGGFVFGRLALSVLDRFEAKEILPKVYIFVYGIINAWTEPLQACLEPLRFAIDVGLAVGYTEDAMFSANVYASTAFWSGQQLEPLMEKLEAYSKQMVEYNQHLVNTMNKPLRQTVLNLLGRSANPIKLVGEEMDESELLMNNEGDGHPIAWSFVYLYRMWLEYIFGEHELAAETAEKNGHLEEHHRGRFVFVCNYVFYSCLNAFALAHKEGRAKYAGTIDNAIAKMEVWVASSAWNSQHKLELLNAEHAYLRGDFPAAAKAYDHAVNLATQRRFIHEKALALERAGIFHLESGDRTVACQYFVEARDCYVKWGAHSKAAHVQEMYL